MNTRKRHNRIAPGEGFTMEMTIPDKPGGSLQRYRLTELGRRLSDR